MNLYNSIVEDWLKRIDSSNLSPNDKKKKRTELNQLTSFIMGLKTSQRIENFEDIKIKDVLRERPDFLINYEGEDIGVEIVTIKNDKVEKVGITNKFLEQVTICFRKKYPDLNLLVNIGFNKYLDYKIFKQDSNKQLVIDFVYNNFNKNETPKPDFISHIFSMPHIETNFYLSEAFVYRDFLDSRLILKHVKDKEANLSKYRENIKNKKVFLLLVVSMASPDSNFIDVIIPPDKIQSDFDAIFLLEDITKQIHSLK